MNSATSNARSCGVEANVLRFLFPLTIEDGVFQQAIDILHGALRDACGSGASH